MRTICAVVRRPEERERELRALFAPIDGELEATSVGLEQELDAASERFQAPVAQAKCYRGKRLRAATLLLMGGASGRLTPAHVQVASIVELIHLSTLVHDDVLDRARLRRGVATPNARFGNAIAVRLGDWLYALAFEMSTALESPLCSRVLTATTATICRGEIEQTRAKFDFTLSEARYLDIIDAKTASLYAASCELGARYAGADEATARAAERFGRCVGLAFQIVDDCLDFDGSEEALGKPLGSDVVEGKVTLPIIHLLARSDASRRRRVEEIFRAPGEFDRVGALQVEFDLAEALAASYAHAEGHLNAALDTIAPFAPSRWRDGLVAVAEYVLRRRW